MINELSINFLLKNDAMFWLLDIIRILEGKSVKSRHDLADIVDNDVKFFLFFLTRYICITLR